jgi:hypothetical protein
MPDEFFKWTDRKGAIISASVCYRKHTALDLREACLSTLGDNRFYVGDPNHLSDKGFKLFVSDVRCNLQMTMDLRQGDR